MAKRCFDALAGVCLIVFGCSGNTNSPPAADGGAGSSGSGGSGASAGTSGTGGSAGDACVPACGEARTCCGSSCTNLQNDPRNCGRCGRVCENTICMGGDCVNPPCSATCTPGTKCCATECCGTGQLCCDPQGPVEIGLRCTAPDERGTCPMGCAPLCKCASPDTPIATATGQVPIASLRAGDLVYSVDRGAIRLVPIARTQRVPARNHRVVRVTLVTGGVLEISALHPTADGRNFGQLVKGGQLDGVQIRDVESIPYEHAATYDILPDSDSGTYFAAGVLLASTMANRADASNACQTR